MQEASSSRTQALRLSRVLRLRWATACAQLVALLVSATFLPHTPRAAVFIVIGGAGVNVVAGLLAKDGGGDRVVAGAIVADVVLLTALLSLLGGPSNPFALLYVLHLTAAMIALPRRLALLVAGAVFAGFAALHIPALTSTELHLHPSDGPAFAAHVRGTWVAFLVTGGTLVVVLGEMSEALRREEQGRERARRAAGLATLAAGAAHELATPLSTIAVVVHELARRLRASADAETAADLRLLKDEVGRCKDVLQSLAPSGDRLAAVAVSAVVHDAVASLGADAHRVDVDVVADATHTLPTRALALALKGLLKNALLADPTAQSRVRVVVNGGVVDVIDRGAGMSDEVLARVGEPFFTTRAPGAGMGLGVFLARAVVDDLGGALTFSSGRGQGTTVTVRLQ